MNTPSVFLDRSSREPLYRQLRRAVAHLIEIGYYGGSVRLPPSRAMAKDLGVSRNTVNLAYQELIVEGYLVSHPRSGILVNAELQRRAQQTIASSGPITVPWKSRFKNCINAEAIERVEHRRRPHRRALAPGRHAGHAAAARPHARTGQSGVAGRPTNRLRDVQGTPGVPGGTQGAETAQGPTYASIS